MSNDDFFTRVFIGRCTLPEKSTKSSPKNPIISQTSGNKINIFTGRQSKIKNRSCFLLVRFDLELTSFLEIWVHKKLWRSVLSNMRVLTRKSKAFSGLLPGLVKFQEWRHSEVSSNQGNFKLPWLKYSCAAGRFEKWVKAEFSNVSYTFFLPELSILRVEYF